LVDTARGWLRPELDELVRILRDAIHPVLRQRAGFQESIVLVDRRRRHGLMVTLWESREAAEASEEQFRASGATTGASAEAGLARTAQWYEVALVTRAGSPAG
jgi:hypothetical protein